MSHLAEDSSVTSGEYPEIAQRYKAGEQLTDEELESGSWMEEENGEDEVE